jgi:hypothetical protein
MHRPPDKLKKGWKLHRDAYNNLLDYVERIKPLPFHGHTQTTTGTMPPPQIKPQTNQFDFILHGDLSGNTTNVELGIAPGYVFAAYRDADQATTAATLPEIQQWPFEPTLEETGTKLTDRGASIRLTKNSVNYIYLELNWTKHSWQIGGADYDGDYAFEAVYDLKDYPNSHIIVDGDGNDPGIFVPIKKIFYTLDTAKFKKYTTQQPPAEDETTTYIAAGVINLDNKGSVVTSSSPQTPGINWFLQGPIYAHKPDNYITALTPARTEPIDPRRAEDYEYPGAENTA